MAFFLSSDSLLLNRNGVQDSRYSSSRSTGALSSMAVKKVEGDYL